MCSDTVGRVRGRRVRNWSPKKHTHTHARRQSMRFFCLQLQFPRSFLFRCCCCWWWSKTNVFFLITVSLRICWVCLFVCICVCIYVVCVLVYRIYFFLCYFPRFCFVISFTFSRRSYWEGIILSVSRCATLLIHKSCRPSRRRRRRRRLFESAKNFSSNRSHVWVAWLTIADWRTNWGNDHLFAANMFDASECNLALQSCCMLNSERV